MSSGSAGAVVIPADLTTIPFRVAHATSSTATELAATLATLLRRKLYVSQWKADLEWARRRRE